MTTNPEALVSGKLYMLIAEIYEIHQKDRMATTAYILNVATRFYTDAAADAAQKKGAGHESVANGHTAAASSESTRPGQEAIANGQSNHAGADHKPAPKPSEARLTAMQEARRSTSMAAYCHKVFGRPIGDFEYENLIHDMTKSNLDGRIAKAVIDRIGVVSGAQREWKVRDLIKPRDLEDILVAEGRFVKQAVMRDKTGKFRPQTAA